MTSLGLVAIGRNEGARLETCLRAALASGFPVVYVDSGSTDGSVQLARGLGVDVVALDASATFTAARGRNAGVARLRESSPALEFVQFVDGDCELDPSWLGKATAALRANARVAAVCGRVRERYPDKSIYNRLCDLEWDTPIGEALSCGGNSMMRLSAFQEVGGFNPTLIAGEEPDLCFRLRERGWKILRVDAEMVLHDAAIERFSQWWTRSVRGGHATAETLERRGLKKAPEAARKVASNLLWSMPAAWPLWPMLWWRVYSGRRDPALATFTVLGKLPHCQGQLTFWARHVSRRASRLIEYK